MIDAGVEADSPYPGADELVSLESLQPFPQVDEYLLEQVVHLFRVLGEHIADRVDPPLVLQDDACKFSFSVVHKSVF